MRDVTHQSLRAAYGRFSGGEQTSLSVKEEKLMGIALAGGWEVFGAFIVVFGIGLVHSLYTRRGSGINQRPWNSPYGDAPGARGSSVLHHDESAASRYTRGTRSGRIRSRPASGPRLERGGRPTSVAAEKIFTRQ